MLEGASLKDDEDERMQQRALLKLYINRSLCAVKLERWDHAITFSNQALDIDAQNSKALYRYMHGATMLRFIGLFYLSCKYHFVGKH